MFFSNIFRSNLSSLFTLNMFKNLFTFFLRLSVDFIHRRHLSLFLNQGHDLQVLLILFIYNILERLFYLYTHNIPYTIFVVMAANAITLNTFAD